MGSTYGFQQLGVIRYGLKKEIMKTLHVNGLWIHRGEWVGVKKGKQLTAMMGGRFKFFGRSWPIIGLDIIGN
jgi:hypothetical protein